MNSIDHLFNIAQKFSPFSGLINDERKIYKTIDSNLFNSVPFSGLINDERKIYKTIDSNLFNSVIHLKHKSPVPSQTKSDGMKHKNSSSFQPKTMEITYKRNRYGNFQIHCPYYIFPAFIYDQYHKAIVGIQVGSEIHQLNKSEKRVCDAWNLHYIDTIFDDPPPPYEFDSRVEPVINKPLPTAPEIEPLADKPGPSAPAIEEFLYRVHEDPFDFT